MYTQTWYTANSASQFTAPFCKRYTHERRSANSATVISDKAIWCAMDNSGSGLQPPPSLINTEYEHSIFPSYSPLPSKGTSRQARKAKRALRRRIKPEQQRCGHRIRSPGPLFEQQSRGMPRLPRGGDGLADISLRPSLALQALQHPKVTVFRSKAFDSVDQQPRRPATSAAHGFPAGKSPCVWENRPHSRSGSAPPNISVEAERESHGVSPKSCVTSGWTETGTVDCDRSLSLDSEEPPDVEPECKTPLPPSRESARGRAPSFSEGRRRLVRNSSPEEDDETLQKQRQQRYQGETWYGDSDVRSFSKDNDEEGEDDFLLVTRPPDTDGDVCENALTIDAQNDLQEAYPLLEEGREARVMLSSNVPLSPRSRCRTPTLPTDRHGLPVDSYHGVHRRRKARAYGDTDCGFDRPMSPVISLEEHWLHSSFGQGVGREVSLGCTFVFGALRESVFETQSLESHCCTTGLP